MLKAQLVSFQAGERAATGTPLSSAAYDADKVESYFDQAFIKEEEIGAGDFGRVFRVRSRVGAIFSTYILLKKKKSKNTSPQLSYGQVDKKVYAVKIARERYRGPTDRASKLEEVI